MNYRRDFQLYSEVVQQSDSLLLLASRERFHRERFHSERFHSERFHSERFHNRALKRAMPEEYRSLRLSGELASQHYNTDKSALRSFFSGMTAGINPTSCRTADGIRSCFLRCIESRLRVAKSPRKRPLRQSTARPIRVRRESRGNLRELAIDLGLLVERDDVESKVVDLVAEHLPLGRPADRLVSCSPPIARPSPTCPATHLRSTG
jgi:hypothetical protein